MKKVFLLADDDIDDKELFTEALYSVDPSAICYIANDGKQVFDILRKKETLRPDLIFLDINMPVMNGWECITALKADPLYKDIPVLIYSTSSNQHDANIAIELGALCFFTKPSSFNDLKNIMQVVVDNIHKDLLNAISHFNQIKSKKVFSCVDEE